MKIKKIVVLCKYGEITANDLSNLFQSHGIEVKKIDKYDEKGSLKNVNLDSFFKKGTIVLVGAIPHNSCGVEDAIALINEKPEVFSNFFVCKSFSGKLSVSKSSVGLLIPQIKKVIETWDNEGNEE